MSPFWVKQSDEPLPAAPALLPLTPKYDPKSHGMYVSAIEAALTGPGSKSMKNLALSGGYGVGKSSILGEVATKHEGSVITISLSTLGFSDKPTETEGVARTASTRTNRIQKEIVKQLLYSQDPVKMPGSRYKRVTRFRFWREVGFAALAAVPLWLLFFLSGWSAALGELVRLPADAVDWINLVIYLAGVVFIVGIRKVMHNRIHIERISAGGTTIALSAQSATFFDEYLDEIVYFFERTTIDVVIFEDIDRFDDPNIFEALRALNSLLNGAKQLDGRVIRFIYAIKDSIFDELGQRAAQEELEGEIDDAPKTEKPRQDEAEIELARANRTKFFDQVIPVVPFVTHLSARNLLKTSLDGEAGEEGGEPEGGIEHEVTNDLIDLVGRYLADMRLIKNVRNEFAIFRQRIIVEGSLDLSDDAVLAMVLYKSTHLSDFERIKHRQSDLDKLYADYRDLINRNIDRLSTQVRADRIAKSRVRPALRRSEELGDRLIAHLDDHVAHQGGRLSGRGFAGEPLDNPALKNPATWRRIADGEDIVVDYSRSVPSYGGNVQMRSTFTKEQLARAVQDPLSPEASAKAERDRLDKRISAANDSIAFLRTASMKQMLVRNEYTLTQGATDNLSSIMERRIGSELARQLVRHGYIDQNFTLYTSTFHGVRVSAEATNFMMKNVDAHTIDMSFALKDEDVETILREKGPSVLEDDAAYNVSFLDYLLRKDGDGAEVLVSRLVRGGVNERALILSYLADGAEPEALVERLTPKWAGILPFLVSDAGLEEARRNSLVDLALRSLAGGIDYEADGPVGEYLTDHHTSMTAFIGNGVPEESAARIATYIDALGLQLPNLARLSTTVRSGIVQAGAFAVNRGNLLIALGGEPAKLPLDVMKSVSKPVFEHALQDVPAYLEALEDDEVSIVAQDAFQSTVADVLAADPAHLIEVVRRADESLEVPDLETVSKGAWVALAIDHRFAPSFANVKGYIEQFDLDEALAGFLTKAEEIVVDEEASEAEKLELALTIIGARDLIPSPAVRSQLVVSLKLAEPIDASSIPVEQGELIGRLVGDGVIADDADAFTRLQADDWPGREYAISRSSSFKIFMTPTELPVAYVGSLLTSGIVEDDVKAALLDRFAEFRPKISRPAFDQAIAYAITSSHGLSVDQLEPIAGWMQPSQVLKLLGPHLASMEDDTLISILTSMKNDYAKLAGPTGKRPKFRPTPELEALIAELDTRGWVSRVVPEGDQIRVSMKQTQH